MSRPVVLYTRQCSLAAALAVSVLAGSLKPHTASAAFTTCRSDPVLTLTNGAQIDLQAGIKDSVSDVQSIVYTVHIPAGTGLVSLVNTDGLLGLSETVKVFADDPADTYDTSTVVYTGASSVGVTATTTVVSALGVTLSAKSASGLSGQSLPIHVASEL